MNKIAANKRVFLVLVTMLLALTLFGGRRAVVHAASGNIDKVYSGYGIDGKSMKISIPGKCKLNFEAYTTGSESLYLVLEDDEYDNIFSQFIYEEDGTFRKTITLDAGTYYVYLDTANEYYVHVWGNVPASLSDKSVVIGKGSSYQLKLIAYSGSTKWKSSNTKVATVSKKGLIKAKKNGKCTITCKIKGKTLKCNVKVVNPMVAQFSSLHPVVTMSKCYVKFTNYTSKKVKYIKLNITQYDNRGKKLKSPYSYYYVNDDLKANSSDEWYFWVNGDTKKVKISLTEVTYADKTKWRP